jgi:hypothetical protein
MKKISIMLTALALFISTLAMAIPEESVSSNVKTAFRTAFAAARSVKWDKVENFYFATFNLDNREVNVAYDEAGEMVGTSEMLRLEDVPLMTRIALRERYENYTISPQVYSISCNGETVYYATVVNEKCMLKLKCGSEGEISVAHKTKLTRQ